MELDKSTEELFAASIVRQMSAEGIRDIAAGARDSNDLPEIERYETAVVSGAHAAASMAFSDLRSVYDEVVAALNDALTACEAAVQKTDSAEVMMLVADIRRPLVEYLRARDAESRRFIATRFAAEYNIAEDLILQADRPDASERDYYRIGLAVMMKAPRVFSGFVLYSQDESMECHCMRCLEARAERSVLDVSKIKEACIRRFGPDLAPALGEFGRYVLGQVRHIYHTPEPGSAADPAQHVTERETEIIARDLIDRLKAGGTSEGS